MALSRSGAWLAANQDGDTLTVWEVRDGTPGPARVLQLKSSGPAALTEGLRQALAGEARPVVLGGSPMAPLQPVPVPLAELPLAELQLDGLAVRALPALGQNAPCAVMRGAVARLAGFLRLNPEWDGVVCLPGAVTHWVQVSAREAVSFQSALTGQLARGTAQGLGLEAAGAWDKSALAEAVDDGLAKPQLLAARLAAAQAAAELGQTAADGARGQLWGLLLGAELAAARPYWLGQNLALIADGTLQPLYAEALAAQGLPVTLADQGRMALEGLIGAQAGA
ncbi:2-dehydro-3-deoxygalactonokinase [Leisingera sp. ANG-Vp]|uniref:2-dehydro-3-deoxygalactonokinase n=1 Tax=Leisingera sp. ANG-Vp TaxID=1577896 RepID=UPI00057C8FF6|nr:2-dehydro-3-deoxygalactonokinase [Leisingera sp. ANG-Vp]KIC14083.1 2-keto-3-deoxy-galactonokinase [Leisingera sp. ANG-Vp]